MGSATFVAEALALAVTKNSYREKAEESGALLTAFNESASFYCAWCKGRYAAILWSLPCEGGGDVSPCRSGLLGPVLRRRGLLGPLRLPGARGIFSLLRQLFCGF